MTFTSGQLSVENVHKTMTIHFFSFGNLCSGSQQPPHPHHNRHIIKVSTSILRPAHTYKSLSWSLHRRHQLIHAAKLWGAFEKFSFIPNVRSELLKILNFNKKKSLHTNHVVMTQESMHTFVLFIYLNSISFNRVGRNVSLVSYCWGWWFAGSIPRRENAVEEQLDWFLFLLRWRKKLDPDNVNYD